MNKQQNVSGPRLSTLSAEKQQKAVTVSILSPLANCWACKHSVALKHISSHFIMDSLDVFFLSFSVSLSLDH